MRKHWPIQAAALLPLVLILAGPATPAHGAPGKVYRYTASLTDGGRTWDELLFVSGNRVELLSKGRADEGGRLQIVEMEGPGQPPRAVRIWEVLPGERRQFLGSVESLPAGQGVRVEILFSGRPAETVATPVEPWTIADTPSMLSLAFATLKDPKGSFTVSVLRPNNRPNEPLIRSFGTIKASYVGDEERAGAPVRKYRLEGESAGFAWVDRKENRIESLEMDDGKDSKGFKLHLVSAQAMDAGGWEEAKRAQLGPPPPSGPVEAVEVKPHPCRVPGSDQEVLCATYPVWENRATKQGRKIGLNIVILPALGTDKQPDPIFELGGGPGQAITQIGGSYSRDLRQKRDVVLVDQRGTGRSNPLHCSLHGEPVDFRRAAGDLFPIDAVRKCREELEKRADLAQYTTTASADDLDEIRRWLGYGKINLSGGSYGTRMAQVYWRRYPETVRSVVISGVAQMDSYIPLAHAAAGQRALDLLLAECASQPDCRSAYPDPHGDLETIRARIAKGAAVTVTNTRTGERQEVRPSWGLIAEGIRFLMYGPVAGSLPLQLHKAAQGDLAPLVQMSIERRLNITEGLDMGMNFSVTCAEDLPFITAEMARERTAGTYLGDYRISQQKAVCEVWPRGTIPADYHERVRSDVPVLLISGERDPVTPPSLAVEASREMTNKLHVIVPRGSHGGGDPCTDGLIRDFLDRASVQGLDASCAAKVYGPVVFMKP